MSMRNLSKAIALAGAFMLGVTGIARAQMAPRLTLAEAQAIIDAAQKSAADKNLRLSIAVVDARGDLIALGRMPGAGPNTTDTAIGKAMTTATFGAPSANLIALGTSPIGQGLQENTGGRYRFIQGAVPIVKGGVLVGAVAGSGATSQQDEDAAKAGLAALK